jgi:hypothetical protein
MEGPSLFWGSRWGRFGRGLTISPFLDFSPPNDN